ncbi:MAG: ABC transporter permease [Chloroflexota bacterium]
MTQYIIRRILWFIPVLFCVGLITFTIAQLTPGGPFDAGRDETSRRMPSGAEQVLRERFGMDLPMWRQFTRYMFFDISTNQETGEREIVWGAIGGNLGPTYSSRGQRTVQQELFEGSGDNPSRFYYSARLGMQALLIAVTFGIPLGVVAALKQNSWIDYFSLLFATSFVALGSLVISILFVVIFATSLGWFNVLPDWDEPIRPWVLPSFALGLASMGYIARLTRSSVLEVKRQDYVRTAHSKGLAEQVVIWRHVVRNALLPVVTIMGPLIAAFLTGTLFAEYIFEVPGMGLKLVQAIGERDYSMIMGGALIYTFILSFSNLLVDLAYGIVDPRISLK